jgi:hypothetical protein
MIQFTAKLRFPTGEVVWALLAAHSPKADAGAPVDYEGAVDLLPRRPEHSNAVALEQEFRQFARELGAWPSFTCVRALAPAIH